MTSEHLESLLRLYEKQQVSLVFEVVEFMAYCPLCKVATVVDKNAQQGMCYDCEMAFPIAWGTN